MLAILRVYFGTFLDFLAGLFGLPVREVVRVTVSKNEKKSVPKTLGKNSGIDRN